VTTRKVKCRAALATAKRVVRVAPAGVVAGTADRLETKMAVPVGEVAHEPGAKGALAEAWAAKAAMPAMPVTPATRERVASRRVVGGEWAALFLKAVQPVAGWEEWGEVRAVETAVPPEA